ncbi:hypothetical protein EV196_102118 [Mariniflexile fucanivorans]|uniref:Uncharacterized protein n=1 Tax=Mariniflexile fucanivorans TaxID=264023 RepID=A0A4R1RNX2_9FLAO|nr:hypothetical protein [Mariniflexile fucanivorans]TCL67562.1 hypothetical protein EV196_102118 [Mariniflexile fucanivorans]
MESILILSIFNIVILLFAFRTKRGLYTITPEKQWSKNIKEFDKNLKSIDDIDLSNYKLGSGHLYE